jgi:hypothetical protein
MSHLLIPGAATATNATMWAAAIDEPDDPKALEVVTASGRRLTLDQWDDQLQGGKRRVNVRRVTFDGLPERSRERVELRRIGSAQVVANATLGTLPTSLPGPEQRPFTVLLGSCFAQKRDGAGSVGRTFSLLPADLRPDLKLLCGDQVYLDAPSFWGIFAGFSESALKRRLLEAYLSAWTQQPGFHSLLANGPNVFSADDHDFWNNAPNGSIIAPATLIKKNRDMWLAEATRLYRAFQRPASPGLIELDLGDLSICVGDVRTNRTPTDGTNARFMTTDDLNGIARWAGKLTTPGCLVLGQVLFQGKAGKISKHMDLGLPDFDQYGDLLAALAGSGQSIVILTGDVHFGRVAVCELLNGKQIVEVVASPMALIARIPPNNWKTAPLSYPDWPTPGRVQRPISTNGTYKYNGNHFATIEFSRLGGTVVMRVKAWPTDNNGKLPTPIRTYEHRIV